MESQHVSPNTPSSPLSVKDWLITVILAAIPIVGLIMLFVWAFGSDTPQTKANWAKAVLLFYVIMIVLYIVFIIVFGAAMFSAMGNYQ
jgi:hypothetical protein